MSPTNRRDALRGGLVLGSTAAAAALSERIAAADPRPAKLDQYEADIHHIARVYRTTPHHDLAERLEPAWVHTEGFLDTRVSARTRHRLTWIAGWQAFYLGTLGFDTGDDDAAREFLSLASQHATDIGDRLLAGSAAAMRSTVAYFTGAYDTAADIAHQARQNAHTYTRPVLAGCEARAAALAGRPEDAHTALADMQDHVWTGGVMPGRTQATKRSPTRSSPSPTPTSERENEPSSTRGPASTSNSPTAPATMSRSPGSTRRSR